MGATRLDGSVAIVTGSSAGIGEAIAKTLARAGAAVAVVSTDIAEARRVAAEVAAAGGRALALQADVTRKDEVTAMAAAAEAQLGAVDILVNCVGGFTRIVPLLEIPEEEWDRIVALNLKSAFLCSQAVAAGMMRRKKGRIISLASQSGRGPNPTAPSFLAYGTSKAGLIGFTRLLARDLGEHNITVNAISPGTTLTPRVRKARDAASIERIIAGNPMKRLVEPEDTAEAVLFLASEAGRCVTGVTLAVNAGNQII